MSNLFNSDSGTLISGLLILLLVAIVVSALFWRMSRRKREAAHAATTPPPATPVSVPAPVLPPVTLEFLTDTGQPISFKLDKPAFTLGRAPDNDIVIPETLPQADTVSQHHARLRRDQDDFIVRDLNSRNGLCVNGRQTLENLLQDGDRLSFGSAVAIFHRPLAGASSTYAGGTESGGAA